MSASRWRGRAFGLTLSGDFDAPGLAGGGAADDGAPVRAVTLRVVPDAEIDAGWSDGGARTLFDTRVAEARFALRHSVDTGYLVEHDYFGRFLAAPDGSAISCAPARMEPWRWQRMLVGQLLPLAALLHGLEPMHASSVSLDGRAVLVLGASGAGKTSVALHLAVAGGGATLLSDDVTAIEIADGIVRAHPGAALASVDRAALARLPGERLPAEHLGLLDDEVRLHLRDLERAPQPIAAVCVLTRRDEARRLSIEALEQGLPRALLGATFNPHAGDAARFVTQLEVAARLAESAALATVEIPPGVDAAEVARAVAGWARGRADAR